MYVDIYIYMHVCIYVMYVHMYVRMYVWSIPVTHFSFFCKTLWCRLPDVCNCTSKVQI